MSNLNLIPYDTPEIRIAIAGMGKMGHYHFNALQQLIERKFEEYYKGGINEQLAKIRIVGVCDILASRMEDVKTDKFTSVEEMLCKTRPHILICATPTKTHEQIALAALGSGIHTFIEKPIVTSFAQINELIKTAETNNCRLMAGHVERYNPVSIKIISLLKNAKPQVENYFFQRIQKHDERITDDIITDKVIHDLDLSIYFFGRIKKITIVDHKLVLNKVSEIGISIEHQNGIKGKIFVSWITENNTKKREIEISQGGHKWTGDFSAKRLWVDDSEIECRVIGMIKPSNNQIKDELVDFIAHCIDNKSLENAIPLLSLNEILESTQWLDYILNKFNQANI